MNRKITGCFYIVAFIITASVANAQQITQTVRGRIVDNITQSPLPGASVTVIKDSTILMGAAADMDGNFRLDNVPVGRQTFKVFYTGYKTQTLADMIVSSGKELILNIQLEESVISMKTFEVTANNKHDAINDMATGSVRTFNTEETERYAGSRGDPARMASNYAGVQGTDDSRNDVVVRGNSPIGLLWRLEGVNIPNPNHFAVAGTTGGPVSILNDKYLATSDFYTGAFPAEYGNSIAGVFDLKMRNGNNEKNEFTGQFGFLGTELFAEGPISKADQSSYLVSFRYSTLQLFQSMHIQIGTDAVPNYMDGAFKLNFPTKKAGTFSLFGIGGKSGIDIIVSKDSTQTQQLYGDQNRDQYFNTYMGVVGFTHTYQINSSSYTHFTLSASVADQLAKDNLVYRDSLERYSSGAAVVDSIIPKLRNNMHEEKVSASFTYNKKFNAQNSMKLGIYADKYYENNIDSNYASQITYTWVYRSNYQGTAILLQPFVQYQFKANDDLVFNGGLHGQYFDQSNSKSIEPRIGMKWNVTKKQALSASFGMHSQLLPTYVYYEQALAPNGAELLTDKNLDFMRSIHYVLSYDVLFTSNAHIKIETYYQTLYDVPVTITPSSFSILNQGSSFNTYYVDSLTKKGTGKNYGVEVTLEKFFSNSFFYMFTGSLYNSKYTGSDGVERNSDFNGNFATNLLVGKEYKIGKQKLTVLNIGGKVTYAGGRLYTPVDNDSSLKVGDKIEIDSLRNTLRFKNYFRADLKIGLRFNRHKISHEFGLDLVNITGAKNLLDYVYSPNPLNPSAGLLQPEYQLGFLPIFYYKVDF